MTIESRIVLAERRRPRPRLERFTIALNPEAAALLRVLAAEWGTTQGEAIDAALRFYFSSGAADAGRVTTGVEGQARIDAAVARAATVGERPVLDRRVHGRPDGGEDGERDGGARIESAGMRAGPKRG